MKIRILFIGFSITSLLPLNSSAADCASLGEGTAWAACMHNMSLEAADKNLNIAYQKLMSVMSQPASREAKQKLIAAQRAWISFRDKECELTQELVGGANHINQTECEQEMTAERAKYIQGLYESYKPLKSPSDRTGAKGTATP